MPKNSRRIPAAFLIFLSAGYAGKIKSPCWTLGGRFAKRRPLAKAFRAGSGRIAQLVEQMTLNHRVPGSSPGAPTKLFKHLQHYASERPFRLGGQLGVFVRHPCASALPSAQRVAGWLRGTAAATSHPDGMERSLTQKPWRPGNAFTWNRSISPNSFLPRSVHLA
jgi:hypothetical protein